MSEFSDQTSAKLCDVIASQRDGEYWLSVEFFPPRTEKGVTNLYSVIDNKLKPLNPIFADFTWGAGGSTSDLTLELCRHIKTEMNLNPNMHLTCTNMDASKVDEALKGCKESGITNIVALRGDPPAGEEAWTATEGGFNCALDLVKHIRAEYGDYFCLSVAGYPEGHPNSMTKVDDISTLTPSELERCATFTNENGEVETTVCLDADFEVEMRYLKEKVDAGANAIITQLFFDNNVFISFVERCRKMGITVPIIPGMMCISSKGGFDRMTKFCKTRVPPELNARVSAATDDTEAKEVGIQVGYEMCKELLEKKATAGLHFYTLNMGNVTCGIVDRLKEEFSFSSGVN
jgi:methylenetetrahydrofolate reductase (NADPH)